jgi:PhnB protein
MEAYLTFNGNCAEAMAFYAKALGGKVAFSMTFGESPEADKFPPETRSWIMHSTVEARGQSLMASDSMPGQPVKGYEGFSLSVQGKDVKEGEQLFKALSEGGKVTMPFGPTFWAAGFGMLVDRFGVPWMVNCEHGDAPQKG